MAIDELPLDILREIIGFSAASSRHQAAILCRVSHAVYDWVGPYLFKTLMYYEDDVEHWPPVPGLSWFETNGKYVRNILWGVDVAKLPPVLERCPHLDNLAVWLYASDNNLTVLLPALSTLRLRRISIELKILFSGSHFQTEQGQHPMFRHITHLDIIQACSMWSHIEGVAQLPCLTHLSLSRRSDNSGAVFGALEQCKQLKILALVRSSTKRYERDIRRSAEEEPMQYDCLDPRVVALLVEVIGDWETGSSGGPDMWVTAEEIVAKRLEERRQVTKL